MIGGIGTPELLLILVIFLMIFGVGKLPQVGKLLGSGIKSFQKGLHGEDDDEEVAKSDKPELLDEDKAAEAGVAEQKRQAERV